jgi:hypothetical protein
MAELVDHDRVVDHEVHGHLRVDLAGIAAELGIRIDSRGRRFRIEGARLWTLLDERGRPLGQAASFARWWWL